MSVSNLACIHLLLAWVLVLGWAQQTRKEAVHPCELPAQHHNGLVSGPWTVGSGSALCAQAFSLG